MEGREANAISGSVKVATLAIAAPFRKKRLGIFMEFIMDWFMRVYTSKICSFRENQVKCLTRLSKLAKVRSYLSATANP